MPVINTTDARQLYTQTLLDVYTQMLAPTSFLRSFFPDDVTPSLELSIEVERLAEKIAVDVVRGTEGNRNDFSRSTQKLFIPPYYREYFDKTKLQLYDYLYSAQSISDGIFLRFIQNVADKMMFIRQLIERAYEKQCADVLTTGIVSLNHGTNIDFKRRAASLVDLGGGNYWANSVDPFEDLQAACTFIRQVGKTGGNVFNAIIGDDAIADLYQNTIFKERQNLFNMSLDRVAPPQRNAAGGVYHGEVTAGPYRVRLWSYPEYYDSATPSTGTPNTSVAYLDPKKVVVIPETPRFKLGFAAVPQVIDGAQVPQTGNFIFGEYVEPRSKEIIVDCESAGVAIPVAVDTIYTFKAVA